MATLLSKYNTPLIEDYVYRDLAFGTGHPSAAKAHDEKVLVLCCSSFSKTLAPGKYRDRIEQHKSMLNVATASPTQLDVAEFMTNGGYVQHLHKLRHIYAKQTAFVRSGVRYYFLLSTRVSHPEGRFILLVEM